MAGDSILLNGTSDERSFTAGSVAGSGAMSMAAIVKPNNISVPVTNYSWLVGWQGDSAYVLGFVDDSGDFTMHTFNGTTERTANTTLTIANNEWYLVGISKASGTTTPRYHIYRYSTDTWEHGNFSGTMANWPSPTQIRWGEPAGGELFGGNLLIGAFWDSELADATFETLERFQADWVAASPDEAWRFDTAGTITPFVGTSTAVNTNDGTLDVGDSPDIWEVSLITTVPLRPDADIVTTGWSTAPLWSKVDEASPDGTVITATAS